MDSVHWRMQLGWLLAIPTSAILYGGVNQESQAVCGFLMGVSLLFLPQPASVRPLGTAHRLIPSWLLMLTVVALILPLVPLPVWLVRLISPERAILALRFPPAETLLAWVPLTLSPAFTIQRLWEIVLVICMFILARNAAVVSKIIPPTIVVLGCTIVALAVADFYFKKNGGKMIVGLYQDPAGHSAGSFANRNHYANWLYVASLFMAGWFLKLFWPLQGSRGSKGKFQGNRTWGLAVFCLIVIGLVAAVLSGSRGGIISFLAGVCVWIVFLKKKSKDNSRWVVLILFCIVALLILAWKSHHLLEQLSRASLSYKTQIWRDACSIFLDFSLFGIGQGAFVHGFSIFKTFGEGSSFLYAENEYLQLFVETGVLGAGILLVAAFLSTKKLVSFTWTGRLEEPEVFIAGLAALGGFLVHAIFEFVFQITANALLLAAILGLLVGLRDRQLLVERLAPVAVRVPWKRIFGFVIVVVSMLQACSFYFYRSSITGDKGMAAASLERSLRCWPMESRRAIALARLQVQSLTRMKGLPFDVAKDKADEIRRELTRAIRLDPMSWELRYERAWLDLAFSQDTELAARSAREASGLNPRQPEIFLRFAQQFAGRDPEIALQFLSEAPKTDEHVMRRVLSSAWALQPDTAILWKMSPLTTVGMQGLGDYASALQLWPLATTAYLQLSNQVSRPKFAENLIRANRPDLALAHLGTTNLNSRARYVTGKALLLLREFLPALDQFRIVWDDSSFRKAIFTPFPALKGGGDLALKSSVQPSELELARELAERISHEPFQTRQLDRLRSLVQKFPQDVRMRYVLVSCELEASNSELAALQASALTEQILKMDSRE